MMLNVGKYTILPYMDAMGIGCISWTFTVNVGEYTIVPSIPVRVTSLVPRNFYPTSIHFKRTPCRMREFESSLAEVAEKTFLSAMRLKGFIFKERLISPVNLS